MLDRLKSLFSPGTPPPDAAHDLRTAVAALLVEAAWSTGGFDPNEQAKVESLLEKRFGISGAEASDLASHGDHAGRDRAHLLPFTKRVLHGMTEEERVGMVEMLWEVAYADGRLDADEEHLITKIAGLLFISPTERNGAKRRAMAKAGVV